MKQQNIKNHSRYIPLWHFIVPVIMLSLLIGGVINLVNSGSENRYSASLILLTDLLLPVFYVFTRMFALRAQDRAIRAEENFRHYVLTGKTLDSRLRLSQIIALRFASDEELPALAKRTAEENLTARQVKEAINNWRADHHRV